MKGNLRDELGLVGWVANTGRFLTLVNRIAATMYDGIAPVLLGYGGLDALMERTYARGGQYGEDAHNLRGLYSWEEAALGPWLRPGQAVLVIAAGAGREAIALLRRGLRVDAWECNVVLQTKGNEILADQGYEERIGYVPPNELPDLRDRPLYDAAILGFSAYSHVLRREHRVALLEGLSRHVRGPILISFVGKRRPSRLKTALRKTFSVVTRRQVDPEVVLTPDGAVSIGFDWEALAEEARQASLAVCRFRNHPPEYPCAILELQPDEAVTGAGRGGSLGARGDHEAMDVEGSH